MESLCLEPIVHAVIVPFRIGVEVKIPVVDTRNMNAISVQLNHIQMIVIPLDGSEDQLFFEENCREMIKMERTIPTLRAELYREIGDFDKCIEYLGSLEPAGEHENNVRELIKERALIGDRTVFRL